MKKLAEGRFEISAKRSVAIDRFMQLRGESRETTCGGERIMFYCYKNGNIALTNPPTTRGRYSIKYSNSTELFAEIKEIGGKTYVSYYTSFSLANNILKIATFTVGTIITVLAIISAIFGDSKIGEFIILAFCLAFYGHFIYRSIKEKSDSPKDSEILVRELEKRVDAVNNWDK